MNVDVELPDLGNDGGDHATVSEWHVEEGEFVKEGEILLEVVTDSGTIEIRAPQSGTLVEIIVEEDEIVRAGEQLGVIEAEEVDDDEEIDVEEQVAEIDANVDDDE